MIEISVGCKLYLQYIKYQTNDGQHKYQLTDDQVMEEKTAQHLASLLVTVIPLVPVNITLLFFAVSR